MNNLDQYWKEYIDGSCNDSAGDSDTTTGGWVCPNCGAWVLGGENHTCWSSWIHHARLPMERKTEVAFKIFKALIKEQVLNEDVIDYKKFCDLIEKLAKVI